MGSAALRALVVDDEAPALDELAYLLRRDPRIASLRTADSAAEVLRLLNEEPADVVFCDIKMPGLDGIELARVLSRFAERPHVVFVTAYDDHAVDAFDLRAVDYVMKPVRAERLAEAVRRVAEFGADEPAVEDETIAVELGGVTRFVRRSEVRFVEAQGDYARLHTATGSHLVRTPLSTLEERWAAAGFARIHRSTLVALQHVSEVRMVDGRCSVRLGAPGTGPVELPVSRRHTREAARPAGAPVSTPERVRVTHPRMQAARRAPARPAVHEIGEQTELGELYMASLIRSQRRLGLGTVLAVALLLGGTAMAGAVLPGFSRASVLGVPAPWLVLGALVYPVLIALAAYGVRHAERNERAFAELVRRR